MMAYEVSESARDNFGKFIYQFQPETKTLIRKLELIFNELYRQNVSLSFNETCLKMHKYIYVTVTYWPSTEPSIKRCMHLCKYAEEQRNRCIRSKISEYHRDLWTWLNSVQMRTPTGSRWVWDNYITRCHRRLWAVSSSCSWSQLGTRCQRENQL